jgi:hypothetical protein
MKTLIAATAIVFATASGAFAASTALDVVHPVKNEAAVISVATSSIDNALVSQANLGDGSPMYVNANGMIDYSATSSIGGADNQVWNDRLGDGSPSYK